MQCDLCTTEGAVLLDLGRQPLANKYPTREEFESEKFYPLKVYWCEECRAAYLGTRVSRAELFEDYYYLSSVNQGLVRHFESLAKRLSDSQFVVDIGSNDGILLKPLKDGGVKALGVDPSVNVAKIANDKGLETLVGFFDENMVSRIVNAYGRPDVVVASSVFTHVDNPKHFIENVRELLADSGTFILEVEYVGRIIETLQFERFYLDRIYYYSLTALLGLLTRAGFNVVDAELVETHGGSLRITARKSGSEPPSAGLISLSNEELVSFTPQRLKQFGDKSTDAVYSLLKLLESFHSERTRVAGYGAPARVSTITNFGNIGPEHVAYLVDDSPLKQGRYSPGMHIPIVPATHLDAEKADVLIVFAYEYFDDIRKKTGNSYRFYLPIPPREVS